MPDVGSVVGRARERGISEILHFTTSTGLIGILASGTLLSRDRLKEDDYVHNVTLLNSPSRDRDAAWTDYVNLSVSIVNSHMLGYSVSWHQTDNIWWAVLAFSVDILGDEGVFFTTTNNVYPVCKRATGLHGFEEMFADRVAWGKFGLIISRPSAMAPHLTTHFQAEVLYPQRIPLDHLTAIYVQEPGHVDEVEAILAGISYGSSVELSNVVVACNPEIFQTG